MKEGRTKKEHEKRKEGKIGNAKEERKRRKKEFGRRKKKLEGRREPERQKEEIEMKKMIK